MSLTNNVGFKDVIGGIKDCILPFRTDPSQFRPRQVQFLNLNAGLHCLLTAVNFPIDSEVLITGFASSAMLRVLKLHGLRPVSVDLDLEGAVGDVEDDLVAVLEERDRAAVDGDGDQDLFVSSGSHEHAQGSEHYRDRLYRNEGNLRFTSAPLPDHRGSSGLASAADFDRDGDLDLFVGGRLRPGEYPLPGQYFQVQKVMVPRH